MHKIFVILISVVSLSVAQHLELHTPDGLLIVSLDNEGFYWQEKAQINSAVLIENIDERLSFIEELFFAKLTNSEHVTVAMLLDEIRFLLELFPRNQYVVVAPYLPEPEPPLIYPMSDGDFSVLYNRIKDEAFADDKLNILRSAADENYFLVEQVEELLDLFAFEEDRLHAVRILNHNILDRENCYRLYSKFEFSDSKESLNSILQ
jgi:hypothetical protein